MTVEVGGHCDKSLENTTVVVFLDYIFCFRGMVFRQSGKSLYRDNLVLFVCVSQYIQLVDMQKLQNNISDGSLSGKTSSFREMFSFKSTTISIYEC